MTRLYQLSTSPSSWKPNTTATDFAQTFVNLTINRHFCCICYLAFVSFIVFGCHYLHALNLNHLRGRHAYRLRNRFIDKVLRCLPFVFAYIDDILIASSSPKERQQHIQEIFKRLEYFGLKINVQKCIFGVPSVEFLGHQIDKIGITPLLSKIEAIKNFPVPTSLKQLRRFVGIVNYYRRFIPKCPDVLN